MFLGAGSANQRQNISFLVFPLNLISVSYQCTQFHPVLPQGSGDNSLSYSFQEGQLADRTALGTTMNILCNDVPIYWAEVRGLGFELCMTAVRASMVHPELRKGLESLGPFLSCIR